MAASELHAHEGARWWRWWRAFLGRRRYEIEAEPVLERPAVLLFSTDDVTDALTEWTRLGHLLRRGTLSPMFSLIVLRVDGTSARHELAPAQARTRRGTTE